MSNLMQNKSEIIFLYDSKYSMPNGDPFTGEQRYDEATKKALVSDVRIKRFIRDHLHNLEEMIYVINDKSHASAEGKESGAAARIKSIKAKYSEEIKDLEAAAKKEKTKFNAGLFCLKKCIDVRLFGGISTEKNHAVNITGPVQFALLNPSLNKVDLRMHQNTSVFSSSAEKGQGAIGTTSVVPYSINQIHGWANPFLAKNTELSDDDLGKMFKALWDSVNNANTRSKSNQSSLVLFQVIYSNSTDKLYGVDKWVGFNSEKRDEEVRSMDDYSFDFSKMIEKSKNEKVKEIRYYTEIEEIENAIKGKKKFTKMTF